MQDIEGNELVRLISTLYRKGNMFFSDRNQEAGLTSGQTPFLMITCEDGMLPQSRYCERLDMDKSTVAKMLCKLESQGYVERRQSKEDFRSVDVYPTPKGKCLYPTLKKNGEDWANILTQGLTPIEKAIFIELLEKTVGNAVRYFEGEKR